MNKRNKIQKAGFLFGVVCRYLGALMTVLFTALLPNEDTVVNKPFIIPAIVGIALFLYGFWRTGGILDD